ncbi:MAG: hypothetical protein M0Z59_06800 [Nitrospiraceae bacterium]|nr:hypothetical protein [Nitrospiraceae bacterium]
MITTRRIFFPGGPALFLFAMSIALIALPVAVYSAETAGQEKKPSAAVLMRQLQSKYEKFDQATGNVEIRMAGRSGEQGKQMDMEQTIYRKGGEKFRIETETTVPATREAPGRSFRTIVIYNGKEGWAVSPSGQVSKLTKEDEQRIQRKNYWWKSITAESMITGLEKVDGRDCYVVVPGSAEAPFTREWIDSKDLVLVKALSSGPQGQEVEFRFSGFRPVDGWQVPFRTETAVDGRQVSVTEIKSFETGKGLPDSLFEQPHAPEGQKSGN